MIWVQRDILLDFRLVYALQYCQSMPDAGDTHLFQLFMLQSDKSFADNFVFCSRENQQSDRKAPSVSSVLDHSPRNVSQY